MDHKKEQFQKRVPIRRRVMGIVLLTTLISIVAASVTGFICINLIKTSSEKAITNEIIHNIKSTVEQKAVAADARLEHYEKYIELVTDYIENMYLDEENMISGGSLFYAPVDTHEYMMSRGFAYEDPDPEEYTDEMRFFSNLQRVWEPIAKENSGLISTVYAGTKSGLLISYDPWCYLSVPEDGKELIYDYFGSGWYSEGIKRAPEDGAFFTDLYVDSQGRGLTITVAAPFFDKDGKFMGVDAADFDITNLYDELLAFDLGEGTYSFALDKDGMLISPDGADVDERGYTGLTDEDIKAVISNEEGILEKEDAVYVSVPVKRAGWTLCACVPLSFIQDSMDYAERPIYFAYIAFIIVAALIIMFTLIAVNRAARSITRPMEMLGDDIQIIADGNLDYRAKVYRNDEIGDITSNMNAMVDRLQFTMNELISTQQHADEMTRLATRDSLTGLRNKTAFDENVKIVARELKEGSTEFGFVMIDLNNLKPINDYYGHDKGDITIKKLADIICTVFRHSPVFRIGGDEFVVLLRNRDYRNVSDLIGRFTSKIRSVSEDDTLEPWERVSAASGYALFDETKDTGPETVLSRADQDMYKNKTNMKR